MAFADPQSVTVNAVAQSMPLIVTEPRKGIYRKADGTFQYTISHTPSKKRVRSMARLDQFAVVEDPISQTNDSEFLAVYLVIDRPVFGFTQTQVEQLAAALVAEVDTSVVAKLFAQEH